MKKHEIIDNRWVLHNLIQRDGFWMARVRDMKLGKTRYYSTRMKVHRDAMKAARGWIEVLKAEETAPTQQTFEAAYKEYLSFKTNRLRAISMENQVTDATRMFYPAFGKRVVSTIGFGDVERWNKAMEDRGLAATTRRLYVGRLRSFFLWAVDRGYAAENVVRGLRPVRVKRKAHPVLTTEQARQLLAVPMKPRLRLAILLALHTGLRRQNVKLLKWGDVDLARRRIFIHGPCMKVDFDFETGIHKELAEELRKLPFLDPKAHVLGTDRWRPGLDFNVALTKAGLPHMRWHDLRHTFAAWAGKRGSHDMKMALLAHTPRDMTDNYGGVLFEEKLAAIDTFPPLLSSPDCASVSVSQRTI